MHQRAAAYPNISTANLQDLHSRLLEKSEPDIDGTMIALCGLEFD